MNTLKKFILSPYYFYFAAAFAVFFGAEFIRSLVQNDPIWQILIMFFAFAIWAHDAKLSYLYHNDRSSYYDELEGF